MTTPERSPWNQLIERQLPSINYPQLFKVMLLLYLADVLIPDAIPFVDEVLLGLLTLLVGSWKSRREPTQRPPSDDTPSLPGR